MKARHLILFAATLVLTACSSNRKAIPIDLREGEDIKNRHSKGSWLPHNS